MENTTRLSLGDINAIETLEDPKGGEGRKDQAGDTDESTSTNTALTCPDTEKGPRNRNRAREVTFGRGKGVCGRGGLEDEEGEEDENLGPDACAVGVCVATKGFESGEEDEDGRPSVPEREGEVDKDLVTEVPSVMVLLDNVVNVRNGRAHEESKDERDDIVSAAPDIDVNGVENGEERETPADAVNDDFFARVGELVKEGAEEEKMDERPDAKGPMGGGEVRFLGVAVNVAWTSNGVNVASEEEEEDDNVYNLQSVVSFLFQK